MGIYVEAQTAINQRRMVEFETQVAQAQAAELAKEAAAGLSISADNQTSIAQ